MFLVVQLIHVFLGMVGPPPAIPRNDGKNVTVYGILYKREIKSTYQILYLKQGQMHENGLWCEISNIIIYDYKCNEIKLGNSVLAKGELELFSEPSNPGNFNQKFYYEKQKIYGKVQGESIRIGGSENILMSKLDRWKVGWSKLLHDVAGEETGGILDAILIGDKTNMDEEMKELYQKSGIGHIFAISGLHISFMGMLVYQLLRKLNMPIGASAFLGSLGLFLYVLMIGWSVSAIRALIMFLMRMGAIVTGRKYDAPTALFVAASVIVWQSPLYLFDAGFLLSFGAILGIVLVLPSLGKEANDEKKWLQGINAGLSIQVMIFPIILYFYFECSPYSLLLNIIVVPLMSILLAGAILGSGLSIIWTLGGGVLLNGCGRVFDFYEWLCNLCMKLPGSHIIIGQPRIWQVILYYLLIIGMILFFKKSKKIIYITMFALLVTMAALPKLSYGRGGEMEIVMLDVGQGDSIFIRGPSGRTYLFDGGSSDIKQIGKYRIEPFLKSQGVESIDYVFVSHGDSDHINGIAEMLERQDLGVEIKNLILPVRAVWDEGLENLVAIALEAAVNVYEMESEENVCESELFITCIQPVGEYDGESGNASSMVLDVKYKKFDLLMTGDVEGQGEEELLQNLEEKTYDMLKAAHHGSKNSSKMEILEKIQPQYTLISAGVENTYGHPHQETMDRLKNCGSEIYLTAEDGYIAFRTNGEYIEKFSFFGGIYDMIKNRL